MPRTDWELYDAPAVGDSPTLVVRKLQVAVKPSPFALFFGALDAPLPGEVMAFNPPQRMDLHTFFDRLAEAMQDQGGECLNQEDCDLLCQNLHALHMARCVLHLATNDAPAIQTINIVATKIWKWTTRIAHAFHVNARKATSVSYVHSRGPSSFSGVLERARCLPYICRDMTVTKNDASLLSFALEKWALDVSQGGMQVLVERLQRKLRSNETHSHALPVKNIIGDPKNAFFALRNVHDALDVESRDGGSAADILQQGRAIDTLVKMVNYGAAIAWKGGEPGVE